MHSLRGLALLSTCVILAGATYAVAHGNDHHDDADDDGARAPRIAQVVALDECDPTTFNAALGESGGGFCHNVALAALGFATTLDDLFLKAGKGTPDPGWDFEPDEMTIEKGTVISVVDQGGEPHTFTEVKRFGGGFVEGLNHGEATIPECEGGFSNLKVARTRVVQGSHVDLPNLSRGKHKFQCCIHPWMHFEVDVK
jgi:plastocyanin